MNIDTESLALLSFVLQDSPKDREYILCVLARSNQIPTKIAFHSNTEYPTFYGYSNSRIPFYLMGKGILSNVPRIGHFEPKRLISAYNLSFTEAFINSATNWDIDQKREYVSKYITLENKTAYKDAELFMIFRQPALTYIKQYANSHRDEIETFIGAEHKLNWKEQEEMPIEQLSPPGRCNRLATFIFIF